MASKKEQCVYICWDYGRNFEWIDNLGEEAYEVDAKQYDCYIKVLLPSNEMLKRNRGICVGVAPIPVRKP